MDVRSIEDVAPVVEHNGTVPVWWLVSPREMHDITAGGHLELVSEFEVAGGGLVDPHSHPTHEFYYVTAGKGIMTIAGEEREISQGDLVHIPPERGAQPPAGERPRADPLLLLRGRRQGRRTRRLHALSHEWRASSSPAASPTAASIRCSPRVTRSSPATTTPRSPPRSCADAVRDVDAVVCLLTDRIDDGVLAAARRPAAGRRQRRGRLRQHRRRRRDRARHRGVQHARACSTRRPPTSRSC